MSKRVRLIILGILILIFIIAWVNVLVKVGKEPEKIDLVADHLKSDSPKIGAVKSNEKAKSNKVIRVKTFASLTERKKQIERIKSPYRKNPFRRKKVNIVKKNNRRIIQPKMTIRLKKYSLKAILYAWDSKKTSFAVINDKYLKEGDYVERYKVSKILEKKVLLEKEGQIYFLELEEK